MYYTKCKKDVPKVTSQKERILTFYLFELNDLVSQIWEVWIYQKFLINLKRQAIN